MLREVIDGLAVCRVERSVPARIVFVHGVMDRGATFLAVARRLEHASWITYDRRGYGRSVATTVPSFDDHVDDLVGLLGAEARRGPVVVVGHSLGGTIALRAACTSPESVTAVVVHEPPAPWLDWWPIADAEGRRIEDEVPEVAVVRMMDRIAGPGVWERLPERTRHQRISEGPVMVSELVGARAPDNGDLHDLVAPVVVTRSASSGGHRARAQRWFLDVLHDGRGHVFDDGGHNIQSTHPRSVVDLLTPIIGRVSDTDPT